ncbi:TonB-dependent receptor [Phenylobacterium sp.]|jgi:outer membrane receptor protein involved in Fe transport|uniref:TonB-dependent receptor n=1 Tax=Phenylobacterium sp. TaxID=1871053 RepID=UPI002E339DE3|nr:TonB-dependent receptor [Phenylobacterium sp.]HEX3365302.1 TonB-dependent receptor [Phenylobacterium sp.]
MTYRNLFFSGASCFVLAAFAAPALAADAAASAGGGIAVEEVVVTAQLREQTLQNVPIAVTALSSATLKQAGVIDMSGVANLVPALSAQETNSAANQSYKIRGIGSDANTPTFEPDVALFVDGVYLPRSGMSVDDLGAVARVEVLEGPQSTLYGKNATAGVINVVTEAPSHTLTGSLEGSYSNLDGGLSASVWRFAGYVSGPINDRLRYSLSAVNYSQGDTFKNLFPGAGNANDMNRYSVRGQIEADLWQDTTLRVAASRSEVYNTKSNDPDVMYYAAPGQPGGPNNAYKLDFGPLGAVEGITPCADNNPNNRVICTSSPIRTSTFSNVVSATLNSKIGRNTLTSITALSDYGDRLDWADAALVVMPVVNYTDTQQGGTFSQEIRLASPTGDKLEWLGGLYFQHVGFARGDDGDSPTFTLDPAAAHIPLPHTPALPAAFVLGQPGDEGFLNSKSRSSYEAVFGQSSYHINDKLSVTAGLRVQTEEKHASVDNAYKVSAATPNLPLGPCGNFPLNLITASLTPVNLPACPLVPINAAFDHRTSMLTWNLTGEYHPTTDTMLYATVSRGGKSFGYNIGFGSATPGVREFKDEYVTSYEIGVKSKLLDGRAQVSADAFYADYRNYQNAGLIGLQFLVNNAPKVSVKGFEANGNFALGHGFNANAGVTYVDATYDSYPNGSPFFTAAGPSSGNMTGENLPLVPHWRSVVGLQYKQPTQWGSLYGRVDWTWQSKDLTNTNLDPRSLQPAYSLVALRGGIKFDGGWDMSLWANNVFNTTYTVQDAVSPLFGFTDPEFMRFLGRPREAGLTVRRSF